MAEYTRILVDRSNAAVYGSGETYTRPYDYDIPTFGTPSNSLTHAQVTAGYSNGSSIGILKGWAVYAKSGATVSFYEDSLGTKQVGPSGGKGGQDDNPSRSGTVTNPEFVGIFTGNATKDYLEVTWINKWWQDASWKAWIPFAAIKKGEYKTENKISWVKISDVEWQATYVPAADRQDAINKDKELKDLLNNPPATTNAGIDSTTLGLLAVGAAFLLKKKKKRK